MVVSLNSRLESNEEEEEGVSYERGTPVDLTQHDPCGTDKARAESGLQGSLIRNTHPHRTTIGP